jgi:hypothetical protein
MEAECRGLVSDNIMQLIFLQVNNGVPRVQWDLAPTVCPLGIEIEGALKIAAWAECKTSMPKSLYSDAANI